MKKINFSRLYHVYESPDLYQKLPASTKEKIEENISAIDKSRHQYISIEDQHDQINEFLSELDIFAVQQLIEKEDILKEALIIRSDLEKKGREAQDFEIQLKDTIRGFAFLDDEEKAKRAFVLSSIGDSDLISHVEKHKLFDWEWCESSIYDMASKIEGAAIALRELDNIDIDLSLDMSEHFHEGSGQYESNKNIAGICASYGDVTISSKTLSEAINHEVEMYSDDFDLSLIAAFTNIKRKIIAVLDEVEDGIKAGQPLENNK